MEFSQSVSKKCKISCILHLKTFPVFLQTGNKNVRMHPENREDRLFICCNTIYRKKSNVHFFLKYVRFFPVLLCMASQTAYFAPLNVVFLRKYGVFALHTYAPCLTTCCHHARYGCTQILAIFSSFWLFICKYRKYEGFGFFKVKAKRRYRLHLCHAALQET